MKKINRSALFLIITFTLTYSIAIVYRILSGGIINQNAFTILALITMFIPFFSVIIVKKIIFKESIKTTPLFSFSTGLNKWFFIAWLIFPVIVLCTIGISQLFPYLTYNSEITNFLNRFDIDLPPDYVEDINFAIESLPINYFLLNFLLGLAAGISVNALAAFGEEIGWRGFLLIEFREMPFLKASIIIGFIWGIWHIPLILMGHNYPQHPKAGVFMMIVFCILLTPILQYITIKSKSIFPACVAHGTLNALAGLAIMTTNGGNDLTAGITGLPGFITLLIFCIGFYVYDFYISKEKIFVNKISNYI